MRDSVNLQHVNGSIIEPGPQCQYFVVRKKRLCRMTVKPGRNYCGEHEPQPKTADGQDDTRIPCPNDPKHTCYVSKLEKHLTICNARPMQQPPYIVHNINAPAEVEVYHRQPLSQLSKEIVLKVIEKVNDLYDKHVKGHIAMEPEYPIHSAVLEEFSEGDRTESSLRHLRQVSSLLWVAESERLVQDNTCYVELGAGKGHVSYYVCKAWCQAGSCALLVDRASLRHKRDNAVRGPGRPDQGAGPDRCVRVRADLAHLALAQQPEAARAASLVGLAKHLCGVATDYALRCMTAEGVADMTRGLVLATCCHHRCDRAAYVANHHLRELGIDGDEFNVMLGIVSWATCGDGRSREQRRREGPPAAPDRATLDQAVPERAALDQAAPEQAAPKQAAPEQAAPEQAAPEQAAPEQAAPEQAAPEQAAPEQAAPERAAPERAGLAREEREEVGRRAKRLLDWGRVLHLRERGFEARLCYFVPTSVSPENICIVATKHN